jgi:hypothetical protein
MPSHTRYVLLFLLVVLGGVCWCLSATSSLATAEILIAHWKQAAKNVRSAQGNVHIWHYDPIWGDKEFSGQFWYTANNRGAYFQKPLLPGNAHEWIYIEWDESQVKVIENQSRSMTKLIFPSAIRSQYAAGLRQRQQRVSTFSESFAIALTRFFLPSEHLPFIIPREGNLWADDFHWNPMFCDVNWLTTGWLENDESKSERIDLIMDLKSGLPLGVQVHEPGPERKRKVFIVSDLEINPQVLQDIAPAIDHTSAKWKITRESVPQTAKKN